MNFDTTYSAKSAAVRAARKAGLDPKACQISREGSSGRWRVQAPSAKAPAPIFPPANATRANELKRARAEREAKAAEKKTPRGEKKAGAGGKRAEILAAAEAGKLPPVPDFSAETHRRFRPKLAELVALVKAKEVKKLKAYPINPISTSPKAMDRYRNLAVIALEAQANGAKQKAAA